MNPQTGATHTEHSNPHTDASGADRDKTQVYSDSVYESVAVVAAAFSRPPFDEEWDIEGFRVDGLLRNGEITTRFLKLLYEEGERELIEEDKKEKWQIDRKKFNAVLNTYVDTLSKSNLLGLVNEKTGIMTMDEIMNIILCTERLNASDKEKITIIADYPTKKLLDTYTREANDPDSLVLLGGLDEEGKFALRRVETSSSATFSNPEAIARIRNINPNEVESAITDELSHYLSPGDLDLLLVEANLDENKRTAYLGEIAKVDQTINDLTLNVGFRYFTDIVKQQLEKLPQQLVYFTLKGTTVADRGLETLANRAVRATVSKEYAYKQTDYEVKWNGIPMIFGVLKLVKRDKVDGTK